MRKPTGEQDQLVLLGHNGAVVCGGDVVVVFPSRVVDAQLTAAERFRLAMEEIDECDFARHDRFRAVVDVTAEEVAVVAGSDLGLDVGNRKRIATPPSENARQAGQKTIHDHLFMPAHIHQHA